MGWQDGTLIEEQPQAAWMQGTVVDEPKPTAIAQGIGEAFRSGYQSSATGLMLRGKLPDIVLDPHHAKWYEKAAASVGQMVSDLPEMIGGAIGGGAGGTAAGGPVGAILGGGAGAFAVPAAIRESLMQAYSKGAVTSSGDFLNRVGIVLKQTAKEAAVGAATFGVGGAVARVTGKAIAPAIGETLSVPAARAAIGAAQTGAEVGTMVVAPAVLEGRLPEPEDFVNAAIVVAFAKGAMGVAQPAVNAVAGRLQNVYQRTGIRPEQVVADAKANPEIQADLTTGEQPIPRAYQPLAATEVVANAMPEPKKLEAVLANINAPIPDAKTPGHINYRYVEDADGLHAIFAAGSAAFEKEIAERRAAPKGWDTSLAEARATLAQAQGRSVIEVPTGTTALDAQMLQHNAMLIDAAADLKAAMRTVADKGEDVTEAEVRSQMLAAQNLEATLAFTLGKNAEVARALNILKATKQMTALASEIKELRDKYGTDPQLFAKMGLAMDTPAKLAKFLNDTTVWEKVVEAWKAGILSGPVTHMANIIGNLTFAAIRPVVDLTAASIGRLSGAQERVSFAEPFARIFGNLQGAVDAIRIASAALNAAYEKGGVAGAIKEAAVGTEVAGPQKVEQFRKAIGGVKGDVIRLPFRALSLADEFFKVMASQGEKYALATRKAVEEGFNPATREFRERVSDLAQNDTAIQIAAHDAALRFTFNMPLGEKGQAVSNLVRKAHLELFVPFVRTPGNILKELVRMTPAAPMIGEWRAAIAEGGAAQAKAVAEISMGSSIMGVVGMLAFNGQISGQGSPDKGKRNLAEGVVQPYSVFIDGKWYNYQRLQPLGTLVGMAADLAEIWDHLTDEEADKVPKMVAVAFANAVTNQTFLQGITNIVNAMSDPRRFGPKLAQGMAASVIPAAVGQPTTMTDPYVREVNSMLDAIRARIPGQREQLLPKRDAFGQPIETKGRLGAISPVTIIPQSEDKVRLEAYRLDVSAADAPKKLHLGRGTGKLGEVEITPEQRNKYAELSGQLAHRILEPIVVAPTWDALPDAVKKKIYQRAFTVAHKNAAANVFTGEERAAAIAQITERTREAMQPNE